MYHTPSYAMLPLIFAAMLSIPILTRAEKKVERKQSVVISGKIDSINEVSITLSPYNIINSSKYVKKLRLSVTDSFSVRLNEVSAPTYISISYTTNSTTQYLSCYLIEPGDSIHIQQDRMGPGFSGKGAIKFLCQYLIKNVKSTFKKDTGGGIDHNRELALSYRANDSISAVRLQILRQYRRYFSTSLYGILEADCIYEPLAELYDSADLLMRYVIKDSLSRILFYQYYQEKYQQLKMDTSTSRIKMLSRYYTDFVLSKIKLDCEFKMYEARIPYGATTTETFIEMCKTINSKLAGVLKQRMLTILIARQRKMDDRTSIVVKKAISQVSEPYLRELIQEMERKTPGAVAFNFKLKDNKERRSS